MRRLRGRTVQVLVAVVAVLGLVAVLAAPAFADADDAPAGTARDEAGQDGVVGGPVVLVGLTGVRWDDVRTLATPGLWDLSRFAEQYRRVFGESPRDTLIRDEAETGSSGGADLPYAT